MIIKEHKICKNKIHIHFLESITDSRFTPIVYIPGLLGTAEHFREEMKLFYPRKCIAISLRGRGKSDVPDQGYSLSDHVSDIKSVISHCGLQKFILMAYSMGVPYAIEYAWQNIDKVKGLMLLDYPARLPKIFEKWVERAIMQFGNSVEKFAKAYQKESKEIELWDRLSEIHCPVYVFRGGKKDALINDDFEEKYRKNTQKLTFIKFEDSGHELWKPDHKKFTDSILVFINKTE